MSAGFLAFIVKPVDPVALVKVIESVCETPR
jgi:hypothetical protein